jgi:hypothetical protein
VTINISEGNDAILPTMDLPVAVSQIAGHSITLTSMKLWTDGVDTEVSDPFAYVDYNDATPDIKFRISGGTLPAGCSAILNVSGSYEV